MRDVYLRLEPRTRAATLEPGIAARVWDPAWMLARQWVLGELDGDDAGTPISATFIVEHHPVTHAEWGKREVPYDPRSKPLDALVEHDGTSDDGTWTLRKRIERGQALLAALRSAGMDTLADDLLTQFPLRELSPSNLAAEPKAAALLALARGRVPDGEGIYREPTVLASWQGAAEKEIAKNWLAELPAPVGASPWNKERFEYEFSVRAESLPTRFVASEHRGVRLDWHGFREAKDPETAAANAVKKPFTLIPTAIRFGGMPEPRYWAFENANIDLGSVQAGPTDLARMAVLQFAFAYGNDTFLLPVPLPVGAFSRVVSLAVADTFGVTIDIGPAARPSDSTRGAWSYLAVSKADGAAGELLFVPPVAPHALQGRALEDATLLRDEMANLVWGVERTIAGQDGRTLERSDEIARTANEPAKPPATGALTYRLQTEVPANWFPLHNVQGTPRKLQLAAIAATGEGPRGRLLPRIGKQIFEEEAPREGVRLRQRYVLARWFDGQTEIWCRTERAVGRGEGSSGLQYDMAVNADEPEPGD